MKIISWNCNRALRGKLHIILNEDADIYCFQECEQPSKWINKIDGNIFHNPIFLGDNPNKGVCILVKKSLSMVEANWGKFFNANNYGEIKDKSMKYFLPIIINDRYTIINCWCHKNNSEHFAYKGQFWKYIITNEKLINKNTIFIGDLNANAIWDDADCWWNMSDNDARLNKVGLYSAYHLKYKEELGKETTPTFFLYRHLDRPYHIDYAYVDKSIYKNFNILDKDIYLKFSDHVPIELNII